MVAITQFQLALSYHKDAVIALKRTTRASWDDRDKKWWIPAEDIYRVADALENILPRVSMRLRTSGHYENIRKIADSALARADASRAASSSIEIPHPDGIDYLPYQYGGIEYIYEAYKRNPTLGALLADEPGLGKTVQALGVLNMYYHEHGRHPKVLLVCPASLKLNWRREAKKWLLGKPSILVVDSKTPQSTLGRYNFTIINYDILKKFALDVCGEDYDFVIFDEAHYVKNHSSQRSKIARIIAHGGSFPILLTGTPITNRPIELWHQLNMIDPARWDSYYGYAYRYCAAHRGEYGFDVSGASNLEELQRILRENYMVRRLKKDVLSELPPKIRQVIEIGGKGYEKVLKNEAKVREKYEQMQSRIDELEKKIEEQSDNQRFKDELRALRAGNSMQMSEIAAARHATALAKLPAVIDFTKNLLESKDKVVVFAHHRDVIEGIQKAFGKEAVILYGGMAESEKDNAVRQFMENDKVRVFVGSITAAGVGLTLTKADTVVFAECSWTPGENSQAADRCHRIGQKNVVLVYHVVLEDSIDATIAQRSIEKEEIIERALN